MCYEQEQCMDNSTVFAAVNDIADFILRYATTLAAVAALTVGVQEAYKKVFSTLARFHRKAVAEWLMQRSANATPKTQLGATLRSGGHYDVPAGTQGRAGGGPAAYAQLLHLTTGIDVEQAARVPSDPAGPLSRNVSRALFELEVAKMMSQIQEAADAALNNPARYPEWFAFITRGCDERDVADWARAMADPAESGHSREQLAAVYSRIRLLVRRQLDSFQTVTAFRWAEWNQFWGWLLGAAFLMAAQLRAVLNAKTAIELGLEQWIPMVLVSLAGGILAPVAKDLVDALAKVKKSV